MFCYLFANAFHYSSMISHTSWIFCWLYKYHRVIKGQMYGWWEWLAVVFLSPPPPAPDELFITALWRVNKTMIKAGMLWLLFLSSWSRGRWGEVNLWMGLPCALCPGPACSLLVQSLSQIARGHEQTDTAGSSGNQWAAWEIRAGFVDWLFSLLWGVAFYLIFCQIRD